MQPVIDATQLTKPCSIGPRGNHSAHLSPCSFFSTYFSPHILSSKCRNYPVDFHQGSWYKTDAWFLFSFFSLLTRSFERPRHCLPLSRRLWKLSSTCAAVKVCSPLTLDVPTPFPPPTPRAASMEVWYPVMSALPSPQIPQMMSGKSFLVVMKVKPVWKTPSMSAVGSCCPHCACPMRFTLPSPTASSQRR